MLDAIPELDRDEFAQVAQILATESGIYLAPNKSAHVVSRLGKRLRQLGLDNFGQYIALLRRPDAADERAALVMAMTTNVTAFFREAHHFAHLAREVLPDLVARARAGGRIRIWSAGCSTGEEPYSIAITLRQACPDADKLDIRILATDIDQQAIAFAQKGIYPPSRIKGLDFTTMGAYFDAQSGPETGVWMGHDLRNLIRFAPLNLMGDWPMRREFDVIFCRNVVFYFDEDRRNRLWQRFADRIAVGGYLYAGHSERLDAASLAHFSLCAVTTYRRLAPSIQKDKSS